MTRGCAAKTEKTTEASTDDRSTSLTPKLLIVSYYRLTVVRIGLAEHVQRESERRQDADDLLVCIQHLGLHPCNEGRGPKECSLSEGNVGVHGKV